jgi:hypothetical protein
MILNVESFIIPRP